MPVEEPIVGVVGPAGPAGPAGPRGPRGWRGLPGPAAVAPPYDDSAVRAWLSHVEQRLKEPALAAPGLSVTPAALAYAPFIAPALLRLGAEVDSLSLGYSPAVDVRHFGVTILGFDAQASQPVATANVAALSAALRWSAAYGGVARRLAGSVGRPRIVARGLDPGFGQVLVLDPAIVPAPQRDRALRGRVHRPAGGRSGGRKRL